MTDSPPWSGFWQYVPETADEEIVAFQNTTVAVRPLQGFILYTQSYFLDIIVTQPRRPPDSVPPDRQAEIDMFRPYRALFGRMQWNEIEDGYSVDHTIELASDPRLEGVTMTYRQTFADDDTIILYHTNGLIEHWRRLSGPGSTPLSGAWESRSERDRWLYFACAGHYAVLRADLDRPLDAEPGDELTDDQVFALARSFGANAGARLETSATFDHWPMIGQVAGYSVRKHETFKIHSVGPNRFTASLPTSDFPPQEWTRLE